MQESQPDQPSRERVPPVVRFLLVANIAVFALVQLGRYAGTDTPLRIVVQWFALWPLGDSVVTVGAAPENPPFLLWQLVTYGFIHADLIHLFFNMFAVWMLGSALERLWGSYHFVIFYVVSVVGAGLVQLLVTSAGGLPTIGASGGVFGILMAYGMMFPNNILVLLFPPIPMKAKYFVVLYGVLELTLGVSAPNSPIAHFAHLGGMLFGFLLIQYWRGRFPWKPRWTLNR